MLLAMDVRSDHRAFLRTAGSLSAEALTHMGAVAWARMQNDHLDLALAVTAHELRGPLVGARAALGHVRIDDTGPKSGELLQQTRDELEQLADLVDPLLRWSAGSSSLRKRPRSTWCTPSTRRSPRVGWSSRRGSGGAGAGVVVRADGLQLGAGDRERGPQRARRSRRTGRRSPSMWTPTARARASACVTGGRRARRRGGI